MEFEELVSKRFSVRDFKGKPVEIEKVEKILEVARLAPTAGNNQPVLLKVMTSQKSIAQVNACMPCEYYPPLMVLVCYDEKQCWKAPYEGVHNGYVDAAIVATHMMLEIHNLGLGTVWLSLFNPVKLREVFDLSKDIVPVALFPIGYPADSYKPAEHHYIRKPLIKLLMK